jgi:hypothetical protein
MLINRRDKTMANKLEALLSQKDFVEKIKSAKNPTEMLNIVKEQLPDYTLDELKSDIKSATESGALSGVDVSKILSGGDVLGSVKDMAKSFNIGKK